MNQQDHYMTIGMEECAEIAQRISKAMRFGLHQVQQEAEDKPEENPQRLDNLQRIREEFIHLVAVLDLIHPAIVEGFSYSPEVALGISSKQVRVDRYLRYSKKIGRLE